MFSLGQIYLIDGQYHGKITQIHSSSLVTVRVLDDDMSEMKIKIGNRLKDWVHLINVRDHEFEEVRNV